MKKTMLVFLALLLVVLTFSACDNQAITIDPVENLPSSYEIVFSVRDTDGTVSQCIGGRDAEGNLYYRDVNGQEVVYQLEKVNLSDNLYRKIYNRYILNPKTGAYELDDRDVSVSRRNFDDFCRNAYNAAQQGTFQELETLNLANVSEDNLLCLDAERFAYYSTVIPYGGSFEAAVEKTTGMCYYAAYENGYTITIVQFTAPYTGNYADLLSMADSTETTNEAVTEESSEGAAENATETNAP
jgi:hypothetical protein